MEEKVVERTIVRATPDELFAILTDFDDYPRWSDEVKSVTVLARDERGRGTKVAYRVAAFGRSTALTLVYDYREAPRRFSWVQESGDITETYDGSYTLDSEGNGSHETEVHYQLSVELKVPLPGFVKRRAESRLGVKILHELKVRAEG
ncbi:MAG: SRPBCC family protein [Acidimicrobiales bacterium]